MKHTNHSDIAECVEASLNILRSKEMSKGGSNADAAYYTVGVLKSLLCESLLYVPEKTQMHILKVLANIGK